MKTKILYIPIIALLALYTTTSCYNTTIQKESLTAAGKTDSVYAQQKAYLDSASQYMQFREGIVEKLNKYDQLIKELKVKMVSQPIGIQAKYREQLNGFDLRNATLEIKIDEYKGENNTDWELFKKTINDKVNELGRSINDIAEVIAQKK